MKAWQLLSSPKNFCTRANARSNGGESVDATTIAACQWCLIGAVMRCYPDVPVRNAIFGRIKASRRIKHLSRWSDSHGWRAVHRLLKRLNI